MKIETLDPEQEFVLRSELERGSKSSREEPSVV